MSHDENGIEMSAVIPAHEIFNTHYAIIASYTIIYAKYRIAYSELNKNRGRKIDFSVTF